ncbi:hypothetical protein N7532_000710 [Penicillium argentinense]|uniref:Uncharacterized protein n=1 Tax=Penicillium argentinense TaxID=1131581 RepID=A0A9W9KNK2_9EURO|nr:uncharacterized protein N7532_000710 [Penicillium argentinense]KAJ5112665.1 hypothetical protein N7532_000710 [Penicillium argentinense]
MGSNLTEDGTGGLLITPGAEGVLDLRILEPLPIDKERAGQTWDQMPTEGNFSKGSMIEQEMKIDHLIGLSRLLFHVRKMLPNLIIMFLSSWLRSDAL